MGNAEVPAEAWQIRAEVRRDEDGELLGFVVPASGDAVPCTVFGSALAGPHADPDTARVLVESCGLDYLTDRWLLRRDQGDLQVRIVEASPQQVVVQNDDYGSGMDMGVRFTVQTPASERLRRT